MQICPYTHPTPPFLFALNSLNLTKKLLQKEKGSWGGGGEGEKQGSFTEGTGKNEREQ